MSDDTLVRIVLEMRAEIAALRRAVAGSTRFGTVHSVDGDKRTVQLKLGEGADGDYLSPPRPWAEIAGAEKSWRPPVEGQQMVLVSPFGDMRQGVALPLAFSDRFSAPTADLDRRILSQFGSSSLSFEGGGDTARLFSDRVDLGGADGKRVARIGDKVHVTFGSSEGYHPIVEGSDKVFAA